jgi:hypothetical protein
MDRRALELSWEVLEGERAATHPERRGRQMDATAFFAGCTRELFNKAGRSVLERARVGSSRARG